MDAGSGLRLRTIVTTASNELMREIHDRMPAIVWPADYREWLDPGERDPLEMQEMLGPYPAEEMEAHAVSRVVNSPRNERPECIEPVEKETLF